MSYADPTLVKAAIDAGSFSGGLISGQSCVLTAGVWDVSNGEGDTISRAVFNLIKAVTIVVVVLLLAMGMRAGLMVGIVLLLTGSKILRLTK